MTTNQIAVVIVVALCLVLVVALVAAWRVGWIARGPVPVGPDGVLERTRRWQDSAAGVYPSYLPQPEERGRHRHHPSPPPEPVGETRPVTVAPVPDPGDMSAVAAMFRGHLPNVPVPQAPTQPEPPTGWDDEPPAPPVSFADYIRGKDQELRDRLADPNHTGLIPAVTSQRGAA